MHDVSAPSVAVKSRPEILAVIKQLRKELQEVYGARLKAVYLFGSHARDEADEDSDIDVAVVLEKMDNFFTELSRCSEIQAALSLENNCLLNLVFMTAEQFDAGDYAIHRSVAGEGIPV